MRLIVCLVCDRMYQHALLMYIIATLVIVYTHVKTASVEYKNEQFWGVLFRIIFEE